MSLALASSKYPIILANAIDSASNPAVHFTVSVSHDIVRKCPALRYRSSKQAGWYLASIAIISPLDSFPSNTLSLIIFAQDRTFASTSKVMTCRRPTLSTFSQKKDRDCNGSCTCAADELIKRGVLGLVSPCKCTSLSDTVGSVSETFLRLGRRSSVEECNIVLHCGCQKALFLTRLAAMPSPSSQVATTNPGGNSPISSKPATSFSRLIYPAPILSLLELAGQLVFTLLSTLWQNIHLLQSMVGLPTGRQFHCRVRRLHSSKQCYYADVLTKVSRKQH